MSINLLRKLVAKKASLESYSDGFISKYIFKIVYPDGLTVQIQTFLAIALILVNIFLLVYLLKRID